MKKKNKELPKYEDLLQFYNDFKNNKAFDKMFEIKQHRASNTYRHVCMVTEESLWYAYKRKLDIDYYSLIRGAFLHDLFLYDWRKDKSKKLGHLINHPRIAYENASKYFALTDIEKDIILNHMFPIKLSIPKTREGRIVSLIDKRVTFQEVFSKKKKILLFDLDGTLIDTVGDLNASVNNALGKFNYPTRTIEQTKADIGNGVGKLIARSIVDQEKNPHYQEILASFKEHYQNNYRNLSKPYENMKKVLITLKKRGYRMAVVTNKFQVGAENLIHDFFPCLFEYVQGEVENLKKKPDPEMINVVIKKMKVIHRNKVIYIGDTNIDYEVAKKANITPLLVSYGYRSREELIALDGETTIIDSPLELLDIFEGNKKDPKN